MPKPNEITLDVYFTTKELKEMLSNATAGGLVHAKVQVEIKAEGVISEVILR